MIEPGSAMGSAARVPIRNPLEVCSMVDDLGHEGACELQIFMDGVPEGAVFVEGRRICWAAARGMAPRLTALLLGRAQCDAQAMERIFWWCKERRVPLGEELVSRGIVTPDDLHGALLGHTSESLVHFAHPEATAVLVRRGSSGYRARFTFATAEVLACAGATEHAAEATIVREEIDAAFFDADWYAAFVRGEGAAPRAIYRSSRAPERATGLVRAGKWAASTLDLVTAFQGENAIVTTGRLDGRATLAFRLGAAIVVGEMDPHGPARVLRRIRARWSSRASDAADTRTRS